MPVVGIGAAAGGLAALERFFAALPAAATGLAFVLVLRLPAARAGAQAKRLRRLAGRPLVPAEDGLAVAPDCVYLVPPGRDPALGAGRLRLLAPAPGGPRLPVDGFFRSLAEDLGRQAVCIILSGAGTDGALGLRAVKAAGGLVLAQAPETARHEGMPHSAGATGLVDFVLAPEAMVPRLLAFAADGRGAGPAPGDAAATLGRILRWARAGTRSWQEDPAAARVCRRMALLHLERAGDYLCYLRHHPAERSVLRRDLRIGATRFFRDPEAFGALQRQVLPALCARSRPGGLRIWVCGCATGEEAYSLAMLVLELGAGRGCRIFASDLEPQAIAQARTGVYPASRAAEVGPGRLARWFSRDPRDGCLRVRAEVRNLVVFSRHDVLQDPPLAGLDLISCRNLLIYLEPEARHALVQRFHQGLEPDGVLFLGLSETPGAAAPGFRLLDARQKLYQRRPDPPAEPGRPAPPAARAALQREWRARVARLQAALGDLGCTNAELRAAREELEAVNEELRCANEDLEASGEQRQAVIEELRAANEELQSENEELQAANGELALDSAGLRRELAGLARAGLDLDRLLTGTGLGILVLDLELRVVRFTPLVTRVFNLLPGDLGRPLAHFRSRLGDAPGLLAACRATLLGQVPRELDRQTAEGAWYHFWLRPSRGGAGELDGLVLTLADRPGRRRLQPESRARRAGGT